VKQNESVSVPCFSRFIYISNKHTIGKFLINFTHKNLLINLSTHYHDVLMFTVLLNYYRKSRNL